MSQVATQVFQFGVGGLYANPIQVPGSSLATPSGPQRFATIQDVDVEFSGKLVDLMGQNQFPDDTAPSDKKITFKAGFAALNIDIYSALFFADTIITGKKVVAPSEQSTPAGGTPAGAIETVIVHSGSGGTGYVTGDKVRPTVGGIGAILTVAATAGAITAFTITEAGEGYATGTALALTTLTGVGTGGEADISAVFANVNATYTVTNGADFVQDLGVQYAGGGYLQPVASAPTEGQYIPGTALNGGVYTVNGTDEGVLLLTSYAYSTTDGRTLQITSHIQGYGPVFEMWLLEPYQGQNGLHLVQCRCSKMSSPLKRAGYVIADFEGEAYASSTQVGENGLPLVAEWFQI